MPEDKFPQSGDPEVLPKPTITRPVGNLARASPYTANGTLRPDGPLWPSELLAPDLASFPQWKRRRGDEWTTKETRDEVKTWLARMLRDHFPDWYGWEVIEKFSATRSPLPVPRPYFVFRILRRSGDALEVSIDFMREDVLDLVRFRKRLALARNTLEVQASG